MKKCTKCGVEKLLEDFYSRTVADKLRVNSECKERTKSNSRKWRQGNLEHCLQRDREYYKTHKDQKTAQIREWKTHNPEYMISYRLAHIYGITPERWEEILTIQKGKCAACGAKPKTRRKWQLDHDHQTNCIRGILCHNCNSALGHARDDIKRLEGLVRYLKNPSVNWPIKLSP
jgi:Autographiviridae endonuclease VII